MSLVIFDLDNTLVKGQSQLYLLFYAIKYKKIKAVHALRIFLWFVAYKLHLVANPNAIVSYSFKKILIDQKTEDIRIFLENFFREVLKNKFNQNILSKLKEHQEKKDKVVLLTNALYPLAEIIAKEFKITTFFATQPEAINGIYTGNLKGNIVYGEEKVRIIKDYYSQDEISSGYIYADHHSDLSLMKLAIHPVAVRPDNYLLEHALKNGWEIIN
ncbi:MAG: HAD-superfamily subfamily IB hydrolase, TIGR01490 [Parcubacteria group bacterium GW2011_GWE2_39_37]|uniref:HAD-superfamily subfamily IB hydrolase, TIGR01490 n=1 Tax=Candidatus Falkowbacteria bacterium GW2011_GWF2_39_8 TaxID=1618642 RepID=A0A0G0PVK4_9BACT|nr:MAG: HAD-superfamily subfamily IB hydrolase, TIGR01490 [Parcubacteria group bacterium GW2011_GWE2_39_37]KKR32184.1 MAG: HAD-superfamily subfamily IB hydrolase, TIGR01490 [Candidatus Falkowbacteria bacterium GW2011_GWF2_39_8]